VRGLGIDVVEVERLRRALARRPRLADRLFTDAERAYAGRAADPGPSLAARFAAKEAVAKALGVGIGAVSWREVEVVRAGTGAPGLALSGRAAALSVARGVDRWHLSLSHTAGLAMAAALAESLPGSSPHGHEAGVR